MEDKPNIRPYIPADIDMLEELWENLWRYHKELQPDNFIGLKHDFNSQLPVSLSNSQVEFIVAELQARVIGFISYRISNMMAVIENLYVLPDFRRHGYGKLLLTAAEEAILRHHPKNIAIDCYVNNYPALHLYSKFGYEAARILLSKKVTAQTVPPSAD